MSAVISPQKSVMIIISLHLHTAFIHGLNGVTNLVLSINLATVCLMPTKANATFKIT